MSLRPQPVAPVPATPPTWPVRPFPTAIRISPFATRWPDFSRRRLCGALLPGANRGWRPGVSADDHHAVSGKLGRPPSRGSRPCADRLEVSPEPGAEGSWIRFFCAQRVPRPPARPAARKSSSGETPGGCRTLGLLKARGPQRTDSTHVLAAIRVLNRLELSRRRSEPRSTSGHRRARLAPVVAPLAWYERYSRRIEESRLPKAKAEREAYAHTVGEDGFLFLDALEAPEAPEGLRELPTLLPCAGRGSAMTNGRRCDRCPQGTPPPWCALQGKP